MSKIYPQCTESNTVIQSKQLIIITIYFILVFLYLGQLLSMLLKEVGYLDTYNLHCILELPHYLSASFRICTGHFLNKINPLYTISVHICIVQSRKR